MAHLAAATASSGPRWSATPCARPRPRGSSCRSTARTGTATVTLDAIDAVGQVPQRRRDRADRDRPPARHAEAGDGPDGPRPLPGRVRHARSRARTTLVFTQTHGRPGRSASSRAGWPSATPTSCGSGRRTRSCCKTVAEATGRPVRPAAPRRSSPPPTRTVPAGHAALAVPGRGGRRCSSSLDVALRRIDLDPAAPAGSRTDFTASRRDRRNRTIVVDAVELESARFLSRPGSHDHARADLRDARAGPPAAAGQPRSLRSAVAGPAGRLARGHRARASGGWAIGRPGRAGPGASRCWPRARSLGLLVGLCRRPRLERGRGRRRRPLRPQGPGRHGRRLRPRAGATPLHELQVDDAEQHLAQVDPRAVVPVPRPARPALAARRRWPRRRGLLALAPAERRPGRPGARRSRRSSPRPRTPAEASRSSRSWPSKDAGQGAREARRAAHRRSRR